MRTPGKAELENLSYDELNELANELAEEDEEIKRVRHYFIEEFWRRIPETPPRAAQLADGQMAAAVVDGKPVLWARVDGRVYALGNRCPHRGFPLSRGKLRGYTLTCAYHGGQFDIRTGACLKHPTETYSCQPFQVRTAEDGTIACEPVPERRQRG
ncbi:MAG TPA: Rieske (2Fe-2S) protein [Candidatus Acidoferrales bacterium]|nr:Rieske (2Fe-2S) protein [Candidatus Acidoferrales bacterium]